MSKQDRLERKADRLADKADRASMAGNDRREARVHAKWEKVNDKLRG